MNIIENFLHYNLISSLKSDELWLQFLSAIAEELTLIKEQIYKSKLLYQYREQEENGILDLSKMFGYTPNLIVDNSLDMLKREYEGIPYRIRNKTTYDGYYIIFKLIAELGEIYNYYWTGEKLVKALNFDKTITFLDDFVLTNPFVNVVPDKNFSVITDSSVYSLDMGLLLDEKFGNKNWTFDENLTISPTKHLGIEYYVDSIILKNNEEYLMTSEYINYLLVGVLYTKRVPIVPHVGVQITGITYENGSNNYFNPNFEYSVPSLKLNVCTAFSYTKNFVNLKDFELDDERTLDETILWSLDKSFDPSTIDFLKQIKYISCGTGKLSMPNTENLDMFEYNKIIIYYPFDDDGDTHTIKDYSISAYNAKVYGQTKKVDGIIGKTVNFDGQTFVKSDTPIRFPTESISLGFWLKPLANENGQDIYFIFDYNIFKLWYVVSEQKVYYSLATMEGSIDNILLNNIYQIIIEIDISNGQFRVFVNSNLVQTSLLQGVYTGEYNLYIGSDLNESNKFYGIIDSLWIMTKFLDTEEKNYSYEKKLGILTHLSNKMAEYELDEQEKFSTDKWLAIFSYVSANTVKNEFAFFEDSSKDIFVGKSNYVFEKQTFYLAYKKVVSTLEGGSSIDVIVKDDGLGGFIKEDGNRVSGSLDYQTGEFSLNRNTVFRVSNFKVSIEDAFSEEGFSLDFENIQKYSLRFTYTIESTAYEAEDDGNGQIVGKGISGTINYENGLVTLQKTQELEEDFLSIYFNYLEDLEILPNSPIYISYITKNNLPITEVGLENENKELMAYMTFPKIELLSSNNHIATNFIIRRL